MLEATLLGQFAVSVGGKPAEIASRPAQALLAYLLLTLGTRHRRERLAALLWPDADEDSARQNLRNALWKLNKALGTGYLLADKLMVSFNPDSPHRLDTALLERAQDDSAEMLIDGVARYRGELLPGFYQEWVLLERERLQAVFERKVQALLDRLVTDERWVEVVDWAERWIALGQVPEPAYRALMTARDALGDAAGVASAYQRCSRELSDQLGVDPAPETERLYRRLTDVARTRRAGATPGLEPEDSGAGPSTPPVPAFLTAEGTGPGIELEAFYGREDELARLDGALERVLRGRTAAVLVTGEAGAGKTSLLREFCRRALAAHPRLVFACGSCDALAGAGDPFLPFREILAMLTGDVEALWRSGRLSHEAARRLWHLIPDTAEALLGRSADLLDTLLPGAALLERAQAYARAGSGEVLAASLAEALAAARARQPDRIRLYEAYAELVEAVAAERPLVLVIDDLHAGSASTVGLLFHLSTRLVARPVLLLAAYREEAVPRRGEDGGEHPLPGAIAELQATHGDIRIALEAGAGSAGSLLDQLIDSEPNRLDEAFRGEFRHRTGGNPLFATELLLHLKRGGGLVRDEDGRWTAGRQLAWSEVPARVDGVLRSRLTGLPPDLREALRVASVVGEEFAAEVVARATGRALPELVLQLSGEADGYHHVIADIGIARTRGRRLSLYRFRHSLFRQHLYEGLGPAHRAHLHEAVGRALEELLDPADGRTAGRLAHHYLQAGLADRAFGFLLTAGKHALELAAYREAVGHLREGLALLEEAAIPSGSEGERELLLTLGSALQAGEGYASERAGATFARARGLCRESGDRNRHFRATWNLWAYHMQHARLQLAHDLGQELLAVARAAADDELLLQAHHALWYTELCRGEFTASRVHADEGIRLYDGTRHHRHAAEFGGHDPGVCARLFAGRALWHLGETELALARAEEGLALARRFAHPSTLAHAHAFAAEVRLLRDEGREAGALAEEAGRLADRHSLVHWSAWARILSGYALAKAGEVAGGIPLIEQGIDAYRATGGRIELPVFLGRLAEAQLLAGQPVRAQLLLEEALALAEGSGEHRYDAELFRLRAELCRQLGDPDAGRGWHARALEAAVSQGALGFVIRLRARNATVAAGE